MTTSPDIRAELLQFVNDELLSGNEICSDDNLLADGFVDSLGMMRLVAAVQEKSGTLIPPQDLTIENFRTIDAIVDYLQRNA
jgi:acyl carrier protein